MQAYLSGMRSPCPLRERIKDHLRQVPRKKNSLGSLCTSGGDESRALAPIAVEQSREMDTTSSSKTHGPFKVQKVSPIGRPVLSPGETPALHGPGERLRARNGSLWVNTSEKSVFPLGRRVREIQCITCSHARRKGNGKYLPRRVLAPSEFGFGHSVGQSNLNQDTHVGSSSRKSFLFFLTHSRLPVSNLFGARERVSRKSATSLCVRLVVTADP